ncbi:MAG: hypothetical protein A4S14_21195 [Proteobacteria bacterium SG_bin9]|nr:MAG: hypothetical protein A4S14_21195 [Proteobacteria bacterium SG_bin9]
MFFVAAAGSALAQGVPSPGGQPGNANPICQRLEGQLAAIDRGVGDPGKAEQVRRYEEAATRQQSELDRITAQGKRLGCDSSGFFSLFSGQNAQCGPVNNQIQQMRANLDQINTSLERLRGGGNIERDQQRRSVLAALGQNNCGPQYASANRQGGFFDNLFGGNQAPAAPSSEFGAPSGTYRTVCVRACDGYYFPISFATSQSRFADDERSCKALCPATDANLYAYRNPGEDINQAVSISGQPYSASPNAFRFRQEFTPSCQCKAAGQTWSDALKNIDDRASAQQGDIIVTEEQAKRLSQPPAGAKQPAAGQKKGAPAPAAANAQPAAAPAPAATGTAAAGTPAENRPIRSVGPTFIPAKQN